MIRMAYAFEVRDTSGTDDLIVSGGQKAVAGQPNFPALPGGGTPKFDLAVRYYSQDACSAAAKSWNRQMQSAGYDTRVEVYGAPIGPDLPNSVYTLTADNRDAKQYEAIDTIGKGLRQRIADANRVAGAGNGAGYSDDVAPELGIE